MGVQERIADIEKEMSRTQINKATERHLGLLKAQLAKLRAQLVEEASKGGDGGPQFDVARTGDARVCLFGFPSVGKSSLLCKLTDKQSEIGDYDFTTLTAVPGILQVNGVDIQLLDLPGILQGASTGYGKGKQVLAVVRSCDLIVYVINAAKADVEIETLTNELHSFGIRVNDTPPMVEITPMVRGGVTIDCVVPQTHLDIEMMKSLATANRFRSGHIRITEDVTIDRFIDAFNIKNLRYIPAMFVYNKVDTLTIEEIDRLARLPKSVVTSVIYDLGLDSIKQKIFNELNICRVYTKPPGDKPDFGKAVLLRKGQTVRDLCNAIHKDLVDNFKGAVVWGRSCKRPGQIVGLSHVLEDEDVACIKTGK
ncbi:GTP-binding protein 1, putative [Trichomonas vaginalis G3]|uniref:Developmentally-regulated GTP-binding protein 1 n=1 Tax=Trichomonas vaginalis (strain ATCC PRA-98 / G3) TaxID=412133 RepID=A2FCT1_TRIV3|nr:GTP binding [Trichomonas vaginalis G3]EAX97305.1 GTP-binding protein 1, putative [Trichomonas vaginalis G3]KAI5518167.1 GTP binding [Trichomonas vaginalis G3]|eukprot:XP_001310235.1 GTP-binding protein 1 [Trichomonas vaginalis G3]